MYFVEYAHLNHDHEVQYKRELCYNLLLVMFVKAWHEFYNQSSLSVPLNGYKAIKSRKSASTFIIIFFPLFIELQRAHYFWYIFFSCSHPNDDYEFLPWICKGVISTKKNVKKGKSQSDWREHHKREALKIYFTPALTCLSYRTKCV